MTSGKPLSLAYSPCPNDTYIFAAWTNGLLDGAPAVNVVLDDVEALNEAALNGRHELTKVSYGAIPYLLERYRILRAGGALGRGCGPLVVGRPGPDGNAAPLDGFRAHARIAIPGQMTTAYLLLRLALQRPIDAVPMRFDRIVEAVAKTQGRTVHGDPFPEKGSIYRSDQFSFAKIGVPGIFVNGGPSYVGRPAGWGEEQQELYVKLHYHQPSDEYSKDWDLEGAVEDARLLLLAGMRIANEAEMPGWNAGNEFEAARKAAIGALAR